MKKQTKLWMVPCAAAAFTMGMSMMSFAATGWQEDGGTWRYYDNGGSLVTDAWKKSGNDMFYLDSNGEMAKSQLIDFDGNYYYVNSSGAMVKNQWREIANDDYYEEEAPESYWYYFQSNGRATRQAIPVIPASSPSRRQTALLKSTHLTLKEKCCLAGLVITLSESQVRMPGRQEPSTVEIPTTARS